MNSEILHGLLDNVALLFLLSVIYELNVLGNLKRFKSLRYYVQGLMVGGIGIIIMSFPFTLESGLIFDTRSILVGAAALVFSTPSVIIAALVLIAYRIFIGGIGMMTGILVVSSTAMIGILWKQYILPSVKISRWLSIYFFGVIIHAVMILCFFAMPYANAINAVRQLGVLIMTLYPVSTTLLGSLLFLQKDREEDKAKLMATEEKYRNLFNNHHTIMMIIEPTSGAIIDVNPAAESFYGWSRADMITMNIEDINTLKREEIFKKIKLARQNLSKRFEFVHRTAKGKLVDVEVFSGPIQIENKTYLYSIVTDASQKKKLEMATREMEEKIHQQQRLESIGTLAGGVAHEINNPINGIMNFAQLIKEDSPENTDIYLYSDMIIRESQRISEIVKSLLQFSRYDKVIHSFSDITDIIDNTLSLVNVTFRRDQITINVDIEQNLPKVRCRSQQIQQVLMNLLTNARDALNDKYPEFDEDKIIELRVFTETIDLTPYVVIQVKDHGPGIHPSVINRIFEPFFSTKPKDKGTGLGLSISFGIIKDHQGIFDVRSEEGEYTCFEVKLPIQGKEAV